MVLFLPSCHLPFVTIMPYRQIRRHTQSYIADGVNGRRLNGDSGIEFGVESPV